MKINPSSHPIHFHEPHDENLNKEQLDTTSPLDVAADPFDLDLQIKEDCMPESQPLTLGCSYRTKPCTVPCTTGCR